MIQNNKKAIIVAYACEPNKTSEPGVGWHFSKEISNIIDTIVLTRANNQEAIENVKKDNRHFLYYDLPNFFLKLKKILPLGTQLYYILWQWGAYFFLKKYIKRNKCKIDIIHHLNFGISWIAPPAFLINKPFIWGPIGGGDFVPLSFLRNMNFKSMIQEIIYFLINQISKFSIFSYLTRNKAEAIIFRTESGVDSIFNNKKEKLSIVSETASSDRIEMKPKIPSNILHVVCVGRMNYWKGFYYAVKGFHYYINQGGKGKLELFGEGPEKSKIIKYIKVNNLEQFITVRGFVDNKVIKRKMEIANVLLHPSFRDGGSWAIMEAMSYGLPVICLNTSGPKDMVTEKCGILIDITSNEKVAIDIAKALKILATNEVMYSNFSKNAILRINSEYNWDKRREQIENIYASVLN
ncbi:glycosyltransferase family 4 protein [Maribacter sp. MAR_2009_72]|uniref:glycosyltransferase family 4 protein n=1 Tax=Maribacter sp. MAR_2009_72 TaxID=1250050 RepID=UPI00119B1D87|nr:glycosyltransferase family 4 protein [Maribacter sp. MAR_2009_72]TVZ16946.1 glycosyltransferase involved in cell wall biosynthesis [Maribacter sp. MAR_2009_72]